VRELAARDRSESALLATIGASAVAGWDSNEQVECGSEP
jgi:hypothetical protein